MDKSSGSESDRPMTTEALRSPVAEHLRQLLLHPDATVRNSASAILTALAHPPEGAQPEPADGQRLWLWKNGDHFLAFTNLYPCFSPGGDPMTLGEPAARAVFKVSHNRTGKPNEPMGVPSDLGAESQGDLTERSGEGVRAPLPSPSSSRYARVAWKAFWSSSPQYEWDELGRAYHQAWEDVATAVLADLRALVANDAHAITFQTMGQYRTALLKAIGQEPESQSQKT